MTREQQLADTLSEMHYWELQANTLDDSIRSMAYSQRTRYTYLALHLSEGLGYPCGIKLDPAVPDWPVAYILLPTGQVSWHMAAFPYPYDDHSTLEKWTRVQCYVGGIK